MKAEFHKISIDFEYLEEIYTINSDPYKTLSELKEKNNDLMQVGCKNMNTDNYKMEKNRYNYLEDLKEKSDGLFQGDKMNIETDNYKMEKYSYEDLVRIFREYGEEKFAPGIAKGIINNRPINTTLELVDVIRNSVPQKYSREKRITLLCIKH